MWRKSFRKTNIKSFTNFLKSYIAQTVYTVCVKCKAVPLEAWSSPEGSRKLRFQDFMTPPQDGGKIVSLMRRPPLHPGNTPGTHFC
jgi:hypothetical protein